MSNLHFIICRIYRPFHHQLDHDGQFEEHPKYSGGVVDYIYMCDVDAMSLIELGTILSERDNIGGHIYY